MNEEVRALKDALENLNPQELRTVIITQGHPMTIFGRISVRKTI